MGEKGKKEEGAGVSLVPKTNEDDEQRVS